MATKKERQRRLARERYERRQQRQADRDRRARRWAASSIAAVLVVGVGLGSAALAGTFSGKSTPTASPSNSLSPAPSASVPSASASPGPTSALVNGKCVYTKTGAPARKVSLPPATPVKGNYQATIATNRGNIVINLLAGKAPCTVNSFISLADQKYFNATACHRLTTKLIYVLQCGDPTGTGTGGPGYEFYSENLTGARYPADTVAMANNSGQPNTNGSQFFLVYRNTNLPPSYTPFGTIVKGLNIVQNVAKAGTDNGSGDGHPKEKVQINSVTIKKT